jgi:hypothetical protein
MPGWSQRAIQKSLIMACLIVTGAVYALSSLPVVEAQAASNHSKVSIELGSVTVWLGMSQTDALAQFQSAGYKVLGDGTTARTNVQDGNHVYSIWFEGGKVICAEREWYSSGVDEMDAVVGALAAIASQGAHSCSVMHDAINEPGQSAERILIDCGQRSVYLAKGKISSANPVNYVSASERVGQIPQS